LFGTSAEREGGYILNTQVLLERFIHPEDIHLHQEHMQEALIAKDNSPRSLETRFIGVDGEICYGISRYQILLDQEGNPTKAYGSLHDFTERRDAEQEVRESQERFRFSLESVGAFYWVSDLEAGSFVYDSEKFFAQFGFDDAPETIEEQVKLIHPDDLPGTLEAFENHMSGKSPIYRSEYRVLTKDGRETLRARQQRWLASPST
jgi:PAS domain S-box-containing protein